MGNSSDMKGTMHHDYHVGRKTKLALRYRLGRRTDEVARSIKRFHPDPNSILDLGTADGLMLSKIKKIFPTAECIGLEYSKDLIADNKDPGIRVIQGDVQDLTIFPDESFNVVIATAVIEHLAKPKRMLSESHRVLRPGGIIILTTPQPFWEKLATLIRHLPADDHQETFTIKKLREHLISQGFNPVLTQKFMISPYGLPKELIIERMARSFGLGFLLLNQIAVGKRL